VSHKHDVPVGVRVVGRGGELDLERGAERHHARGADGRRRAVRLGGRLGRGRVAVARGALVDGVHLGDGAGLDGAHLGNDLVVALADLDR